MYLLVVLACAGLTLALEDDQQYCGPRYTHLCLGKGLHVACRFPVAGSGPNCQNYSRIRFTDELKNYITNFINKRRQRIAAGHERVRGGKHVPPPQVMMYVEWDFELARLAQRLADQCYFVHDECRATVRYPYAGQAVGEVRWRHLSNSYELSAQRGIRRVFDAWWGERRRVEPHQLTQPFRVTEKGLVWGHFSQISVWTLRAVGCGAVRHGEDYPRLLLVCDFSHTNMLGERTLNPGEPAPCPENTRRKVRMNFPLLCASVKEQIKQSRVIEDDTLDESDYDDPDQENPEVTAIRDELKKLGSVITLKPNQNEEDWGNNRLKPSEESTDDPTTKRWTTTAYIEDFGIEEEYMTTTPAVTKAEKKKYKNLKIKMKPKHQTWPTEPTRKIPEEDKKLPEKNHKVASKVSGHYNLRERVPVDLRVENSEDPENDDQETLILSVTSSPFLLQSQKHERVKNKMTTTTAATNVIQNVHMLYNAKPQRWKPERDRPERPGAAALLRPSQAQPVRQAEFAIPPRIAFKMDDDDAEQLQADTGFLPSWKTNKTL